MSAQSSTVLLNRLLTLKEPSPFYLVVDSLAQSAHHFITELVKKSNTNVVYISFETIDRPSYATEFIDCTTQIHSAPKILQHIKEVVANEGPITPRSASLISKRLIIIDSLNYLEPEELTQFVSGCFSPGNTVVGIYHSSVPEPSPRIFNYPTPLNLLSYIASSIFELNPIDISEELEDSILKLYIPINTKTINANNNSGLNSTKYKLTLNNRRKSGRTLTYHYIMDNGEISILKEQEDDNTATEDESLLEGLTTFNLTTNNKQKIARGQVDLPFMQAQESLGSAGGAIVYEFEKDDDYDEEDPYEDPF